jgi:NAD(P)-dependent dehydrogenase (short-subunit alcohol dehydrogenase family)
MSVQKTCLVIGAGAGIGGTVGKRFAEGGYHAALCRRSDVDGLNGMVEDFKASGLSASGHLLNAVDDGALENVIEEVEAIGPIDTVLYNLGAQIGNRSLDDTPLKTFELGWRMACFGLFRVAKVLVPLMIERGAWHDSGHVSYGRYEGKQWPALSCRGDGGASATLPDTER